MGVQGGADVLAHQRNRLPWGSQEKLVQEDGLVQKMRSISVCSFFGLK
jgi:hypothetical protein